jgi:LacI family transcriptional regulator
MITIKNIAEKANVSIGTVDRVLHKRGRVAPKTAEKIEKIIIELGYKPNQFARNLKLSKWFRFGIIMPREEQDGGYWALPAIGMRKALDELKNHKVKGEFYYYDKYSNLSLDSIEKEIISADLDGLLIAPIFASYVTQFFQKLPTQLPYVFFDSDFPKMHPLCVINQNAYQSGRLAAELMSKITQEACVFFVIKVIPEDFHINARVNGFVDFFKDNHELEVTVFEANIENDPACLQELHHCLTERRVDLTGIFVTNALTYCVAEILSTIESESKPALIGYDLIESNAQWLNRGTIDFLISQRPDMQGYHGIYALYRKLVLNESAIRNVVIPLDIITRENMEYHRLSLQDHYK